MRNKPIKNRPLRIMKFNTARLKEFNYDITVGYEEARRVGEVIKLVDGQLLRTVRAVAKRTVSFEHVEKMYAECGVITRMLRKKKFKADAEVLTERMLTLKRRIERSLFIDDIVMIEVAHPAHYEKIFKGGLKVNGKTYRRLSCSAPQARRSNVTLCNVEIIDEVRRRLNNDRDESIPFSPSKFNAYFGLASSATKEVSAPRFIVVPDYHNTAELEAYYVTETDKDLDDIVTKKRVELDMCRNDGMGLITPQQAEKWAKELGLDYIPAEFGVRQMAIKGMVAVFDILEFCKEENGGCYLVDTVYKDSDGKPIKADLRGVDVILSESQFKMWDCFSGVKQYEDNCKRNGLTWGVPQYSSKKCKNILKMNYQFLQTLDIDERRAAKLTKKFEEWISGVSYDDENYMKLFLLGTSLEADKLRGMMKGDTPAWIKAVVANPEMKKDKYIRAKIRELLNTKLKNGCIGEIYLDGNFQTLVSDPYAFMQHICGQEPTGLIGEGEIYSNYWNERGVSEVDCMRAPLTFRSEHVVSRLVKNEKTEKWFKYLTQGIILGWHGHEVCNFAGSDFDLDIAATTCDRTVIESVYRNELTMIYDAPKPRKWVFTEEDLYNADLFGFGSIIGSITNKSSSGYALLDLIKEKYGEESEEYKVTFSRLIQCCKAQSAQIDKTKIGRAVKGIPQVWIRYQKTLDEDGEEERRKKAFYNSILLDKYPYFFIYRYSDCKKKYTEYTQRAEITCKQRWRMTVDELNALVSKSEEQEEFLNNYFRYMPVIISRSPMNLICRRIEQFTRETKKRIKNEEFDYSILKFSNVEYTKSEYKKVTNEIKKLIRERAQAASRATEEDDGIVYEFVNEDAQESLLSTLSDMRAVINIAVDYFYKDNPDKSRDLLWSVLGEYLIPNISTGEYVLPIPNENGDIEYLGERYSAEKIKWSE